MGCRGSKSYDILVEYQGNKRQLTGTLPSFDALNTWILSEFPSLQGRALSLKVNSIPLKSDQEFSYMAKKSESIRIQLEQIKSFVETQFGVVKFGTKTDKIIGTGFLLTKEYIVVYKPMWTSVKSEDLQVILPDDSEFQIKIGSPPLRLTDFFVALQLEREITGFEPISISQVNSYTEDQTGTVLFYSKKLPVLQKYTGKFIYNENTFESALSLEAGGIGSPLISSDNKLLGIYINNKQVFPAFNLGPDVRSHIELYEDSLSDSLDSVAEILIDSFQITTVSIDSRQSKLIYYCPNDTIKKSYSNIDLVFGSVAISTPYGIVITGINSKNESVAYIINKNILITVAPPNRPHLHHSAVLYHDEFYIISGSNPAVESFNFKTQKWTQVAPLSKYRNYSSAISAAKQIFVFGGRRDDKILKSILSFQNGTWTRLMTALPCGIMNIGCIEYKNDILLFGGEGEIGKNKMILKFNVDDFLIESENCFVNYNFGRSSSFYDEREVILFSNDGVLVRFDKLKMMFLQLIVDEEEQNLEFGAVK